MLPLRMGGWALPASNRYKLGMLLDFLNIMLRTVPLKELSGPKDR